MSGAPRFHGPRPGTVAALLLVVGVLPVAAQHRPHDPVESPEARSFIQATVDATRRFASRTEAIRAGYRRLGPDFPGMGEHWVHPGRIVAGVLDPVRPPVLSYVVVAGEPRLVGVAFTLPLAPDEEPPAAPFGTEVWHDHSGGVDEETLLLNHPSSMHATEGGFRLSMVHVWTDAENPDGILAQNNWRLPWLRLELTPPERPDPQAARGLSLAFDGREFYRLLMGRAAALDPAESAHVDLVLDRAATDVERRVAAAQAPEGTTALDPAGLSEVWTTFWAEIRSGVRPETWTAMEGLARRP